MSGHELFVGVLAYLALGCAVHWAFFGVVFVLFGILRAWKGQRWFADSSRRLLLFYMILLPFAVIGNVCWEVLVLNRMYDGFDPWIEWLPFLPPCTPVSLCLLPDFLSELHQGIEPKDLMVAWFLISAPVWMLAWFTYRRLVSLPFASQVYGACISLACCICLLYVSLDFPLAALNALLFALSFAVFIRKRRGGPPVMEAIGALHNTRYGR